MPAERAAELGQGAVEVPGGQSACCRSISRARLGVADVDAHTPGHDQQVVGVAALGGGRCLMSL